MERRQAQAAALVAERNEGPLTEDREEVLRKEREQDFEKLFFMFSREEIRTWWTQYPEPHTTLTGWLAGPKTKKLSNLSDTELIEKALASLSNIFKISIDELKRELVISKVANWPKDPFARGAYSYSTPESE